MEIPTYINALAREPQRRHHVFVIMIFFEVRWNDGVGGGEVGKGKEEGPQAHDDEPPSYPAGLGGARTGTQVREGH